MEAVSGEEHRPLVMLGQDGGSNSKVSRVGMPNILVGYFIYFGCIIPRELGKKTHSHSGKHISLYFV